MAQRPGHHTLRGNKAERSPHHILCWDTETRWEASDGVERHELRLWCARLEHRHGKRGRKGEACAASGTTAQQLADYVESVVPGREALWCFAHNQNFDLSVTQLPIILMRRGWVLTDHAITAPQPWCRLVKGERHIMLADSFSWLPQSLQSIGLAVGVPKPPLPQGEANDAAWEGRCRGDVDTLITAILQLMDWWDQHQLGCWSVSGPSTGWNAYRHIPTPYTVTIERDDSARTWERATISGGRRECWRVGPQPLARYVDIDFEHAHLTVCEHMPLPAKRVAELGPLSVDDWRIDSPRWGLIADCTIETAMPRYPVKLAGRIWHPTGTFRTRLCGPELREARQRNELKLIHGATLHKLSHHMADWARWLRRVIDNEAPATVPAAIIAATRWSRTVPGRWAARTSEEIKRLPADTPSWRLERGILHPGDRPFTRMAMAGVETWTLSDVESENAYPAVLAWIQSHVRVALGRLIDALPPDQLISCNTDGLLLRAGVTPDLVTLAELTWPLAPRVKAVYDTVDVISPQHLILDGRRRLSGVPRAAHTDNGRTFTWQTWPSLRAQLEAGGGPGYSRPQRHADLSHVPIARWVTADGHCIAPAARVTPEGVTELAPWAETLTAWPLPTLREVQHPGLPPLNSAALAASEPAHRQQQLPLAAPA